MDFQIDQEHFQHVQGMKDWIARGERERLDLLRLVAGRAGLPDYMIEKDFWVTIVLEALFTGNFKENLAFKGGTSLSKSWKILNRFSEDIDLVVDKTLFGVNDTDEIGRGQRGRLRKSAHKLILKEVMPDLQHQLEQLGISKEGFNLYGEPDASTDQDPTVIYLDYKPLTEITNDYTKHQVKIEIGVRALMEPSEGRDVSSLLSEYLDIPEVTVVNTILPQRTFWEKVFLLHELFGQPREAMNIERMSRHWYDIDKLANAGYADMAMQDQELFMGIKSHRKIFTKVAGLNYDTLEARSFVIIPPESSLGAWERDYNVMQQSYIYRDAPSLAHLKESIAVLTTQLRALEF